MNVSEIGREENFMVKMRDKTERREVRICSHFSSEASADSKSTDVEQRVQWTPGTRNEILEIRSTK